MPFADHDDVVQAFTSNRADHPLGIRVLLRRAGRNDRLPDVQHPGLMRKSFSAAVLGVFVVGDFVLCGGQAYCRQFVGRQ
jgi:hypothetical protein